MSAECPQLDMGRRQQELHMACSSAWVRTHVHLAYPAYPHPQAQQPKVGGGETDPMPATHTRPWRGHRMFPMAMHGYQEAEDSTVPVGAAIHEREPVGTKHHCGESTGRIEQIYTRLVSE